jgi:hypothetical protein
MPVTFTAVLDGASESPANASPGSGFATVVFDIDAHTMFVDATFADLLGTTTAAHIHCCTAAAGAGTVGVATMTPSFLGFPLGVSSGSFTHTFDMTLASSFSAAFVSSPSYGNGSVATAEAALFQGLLDGKAYFNIHTAQFPGGEIRGFLQQQVPEPRSLALAGLGLLALVWSQRRRQASRVVPLRG